MYSLSRKEVSTWWTWYGSRAGGGIINFSFFFFFLSLSFPRLALASNGQQKDYECSAGYKPLGILSNIPTFNFVHCEITLRLNLYKPRAICINFKEHYQCSRRRNKTFVKHDQNNALHLAPNYTKMFFRGHFVT